MRRNLSQVAPRQLGPLITVLFVIVYAIAVLKTAWLCDDAYITYRTVDNFVNGYGLTWNTAERVQAYTHPLWMFLLSALYFFTREIYYSSIILSILVSLITVLFFAFRIAKSTSIALLGLAVLALSKAFVDYSTSGLENPLTHLIWVAFLFVFLKPEFDFRTILVLSFIAGLATLNRIDTVLMYLPALAYAMTRFRKLKGGYAVIAGFLPFMLWECFSLLYYGFLFPNTAYAKLDIGISGWELAERGLLYLVDSLTLDPLTLLIVAVGMLIPFIGRTWRNVPIVAGVALYLLYIVSIGGDFMSGRYLTAPLLGGLVLLSDRRLMSGKWIWIPAFFAVVIIGFKSPYPTLLSGADYGMNHSTLDVRFVEDERAHYYQASGLFSSARKTAWLNNGLAINHSWATKGEEARLSGPMVVVKGAIGYFGFYAGPDVHIVNIYALSDPLLARLPPRFQLRWVIGHLSRSIPNGYLETLQSGQNLLRHKNLAIYYDKLSLIVRGRLFDEKRLVQIWNFNVGKYDYLLESYPPMFQVDLPANGPNDGKITWSREDDLEGYAGIQVNLNKLRHAAQAEVAIVPLDGEAFVSSQESGIHILYLNRGTRVAVQTLELPVEEKSTSVRVVPLPAVAATKGYDTITILPEEGENINNGIYSIGYIKLLE